MDSDRAHKSRRQVWREHIAACDASGLTSKAYAEQHGLSVQSLYAARKREKAQDGSAPPPAPMVAFARVKASAPAVLASAPSCRVRFANGTVLELGADAHELPALVRCLASLP